MLIGACYAGGEGVQHILEPAVSHGARSRGRGRKIHYPHLAGGVITTTRWRCRGWRKLQWGFRKFSVREDLPS